MSAGLLALFLFILLALGVADKNWLNTPDKIWSRSPGANIYPEHSDTTNGAAAELKAKLATCTEAEAILLNEICEAALRTLRSPKSYSVYKQK